MANVLSGSRAVFELGLAGGDSKKLGYAFGVDVDEEIMHEEVQVLDSLSVIEHVPVAYRVSMSAEVFKTVPADAAAGATLGAPSLSNKPAYVGSLRSLQFMPKMGTADINALKQVNMTAKLFDSGAANQVLGHVEGCRITSARFSLRARQIVAENVRFVAQRFKEFSELG